MFPAKSPPCSALLALALAVGCATPGAGDTLATPTARSLAGTRWVLADLPGSRPAPGVDSTLTFLEQGKLGGLAGCNTFSGRMEFLAGGTVKVGPLAGTKMMCPEAQMEQETRYLAALSGATKISTDGDYLVLQVAGAEKPLRFIPAAK